MGDAGGEPADRFEFLRHPQLDRHAFALAHLVVQLVLQFALLAFGLQDLGNVLSQRQIVGDLPLPIAYWSHKNARPEKATVLAPSLDLGAHFLTRLYRVTNLAVLGLVQFRHGEIRQTDADHVLRAAVAVVMRHRLIYVDQPHARLLHVDNGEMAAGGIQRVITQIQGALECITLGCHGGELGVQLFDFSAWHHAVPHDFAAPGL